MKVAKYRGKDRVDPIESQLRKSRDGRRQGGVPVFFWKEHGMGWAFYGIAVFGLLALGAMVRWIAPGSWVAPAVFGVAWAAAGVYGVVGFETRVLSYPSFREERGAPLAWREAQGLQGMGCVVLFDGKVLNKPEETVTRSHAVLLLDILSWLAPLFPFWWLVMAVQPAKRKR